MTSVESVDPVSELIRDNIRESDLQLLAQRGMDIDAGSAIFEDLENGLPNAIGRYIMLHYVIDPTSHVPKLAKLFQKQPDKHIIRIRTDAIPVIEAIAQRIGYTGSVTSTRANRRRSLVPVYAPPETPLSLSQSIDKNASSKTLKGGAHLGTGRDGTTVYTADELPRAFPAMIRVCAYRYDDPGAPRPCGTDVTTILTDRRDKLENMAVKDIADPEEAIYESSLHAIIRRVFDAEGEPGACSLHPKLNCADVTFMEWPNVARSHRILFFSAFQGDVSAARLDISEVFELALDVLRALAVLQMNNMVHLDVKPQNVLYNGRPKSRRNVSSGRFVLTDYGLVSSVESVQALLEKPSSSEVPGTRGFTSPLLGGQRTALTCMKFDLIAQMAGVRVGASDAYFSSPATRGRIDAAFKVDLHSLALTLMEFVTGTMPAEMIQFMSKLIFMRRDDYADASLALRDGKRLAVEFSSRSKTKGA